MPNRRLMKTTKGPSICAVNLPRKMLLIADRSAFEAKEGAKYRKLERPRVKATAADSERVFHALAGISNKAIERHRYFETQLGHIVLEPDLAGGRLER